MLSLSEAKPGMVKKQAGWVEIIVRACLEAMGEFESGEGESEGLESWLNDDVGGILLVWVYGVLMLDSAFGVQLGGCGRCAGAV